MFQRSGADELIPWYYIWHAWEVLGLKWSYKTRYLMILEWFYSVTCQSNARLVPSKGHDYLLIYPSSHLSWSSSHLIHYGTSDVETAPLTNVKSTYQVNAKSRNCRIIFLSVHQYALQRVNLVVSSILPNDLRMCYVNVKLFDVLKSLVK